ncbi:MAG TPA: hypothetical protein VN132_11130, partial [Bdellovibrio sp.]|nr:hypothetical protein [Bdellovibrio sp.]
QGNVERNLSYINNLIYIESLGVRPGLSGSVLFGTPYIDLLRTYDFSSNSSASALPVEILPKMILGMIVKTRLNGAETVALSLGDIFDFLEEKVANASGSGPASPRTLAVNYRMLGENDHRHLQSYYTLSGSSGPVNVQEYCADEYKNSADFNALKDPRLSKFLEQNKFQFNIPKEQNKADTDSGKKPTFDKFRKPAVPAQPDSQSLPPKNDSIKQNRSGGGEYGEGGDGFTLENTTFLTSETHIGNFKGLDLSFKGLGNSSSMGLYLQEKNCAARGLWVKDHLVHTVQVPGAEPQRMTNFEDLRRFHKTYGWRAADLLLQYGFASQTPFFEKDLKDNESLQIPLVTGEYISSQNKSWSPAGKKYFKQKIAALPATSAQKTSDVLSLRKNSFRLDTGLTLFAPIVDMFSANAPSVGHLQLDYQNHQWHGVFSYGDSCRVELTPDKFKQTNPYRVDYQDGKNEMSLDMFSEKQLLKISFQKLNCADLADLALGEIEIYGDAQLRPVIKTTRTAFVANPLNWSKLKQGYSTSKPGGEK